MKKRYLILALAALELVSLPAAIKLTSGLDLNMGKAETYRSLISVKMNESEKGVATYMVSSDSSFAIVVKKTPVMPIEFADYNISLIAEGTVNGLRFGENATLPGKAKACRQARPGQAVLLYQADKKISAQKGDILDRSIIVKIHYPANHQPEFDFIMQSNSENYSIAPSCEAQAI